MAPKNTGTVGDDPNQLKIDWSAAPVAASRPAAAPPPVQVTEPLVQHLPWDFKTRFPQPTDEAIDNGQLDESDRKPENLRSLHENYFAQCMATLRERDAVLDARRKQIDPKTGSKPRTHAGRERLRTYLAEEPGRLERTLEILIGTYADAFGTDAADAFRKAVTARHAGLEVVTEDRSETPAPVPALPQTRRGTHSSALPVPKPLRSSVKAGVFGYDEDGKPIRPNATEVRAITEDQADRMGDMNDSELQSAVAKYAADFGGKAAGQLERYVRRQRRTR